MKERYTGCLLGGAVGDALGAPVEFMKREVILDRFGPEGITTYAPAYGGIGKITDDTQMTLFTAEGLLRGWVRGCLRGISSLESVTSHSYISWLRTQGEINNKRLGSGDKKLSGWLIQHKELHNRRAPGNTCISALKAMQHYGEKSSNDSKGCGGVMRVAPAGLFLRRLHGASSPMDAFHMGAALTIITHGHPTGVLTAGFFSALINTLVDGARLTDALNAAKLCLRTQDHHEETLSAIERAEELAKSSMKYEDAIALLGRGWVAEEALAISIYCALVARDFRHGVLLAVNHDGDSDSTGSITGNLLGTMLGINSIPNEWLEPLELRQVIVELAGDLYDFADWDIDDDSDDVELNSRIWKKYPGY